MTRKKIEVQGTTETDWTAVIEVDVPDQVLNSPDPDALSVWVEMTVSAGEIKKAREDLTSRENQTGADLLD